MYILDNIITAMKERHILQKDVLEKLGLSSATFADWKKGKSNSYITYLPKIAEILDVPVEYLELENPNSAENIGIASKMLYAKTYEREYLASSIIKEKLPSDDKMIMLSRFFECNPLYFRGYDFKRQPESNIKKVSFDDILIDLLEILNTISASEDYRVLQIQISRIIIKNINKDVNSDKLKEIGITAKKVDFLYSNKMPNMLKAEEVGLNFSDLMRIREAFGVSYVSMFVNSDK